MRSVSSALVGMAAKTSRKVSEGVRAHEDDAAFETLTGIDHTVQRCCWSPRDGPSWPAAS
ncbi:hypothetical protein SHIRM173S_03239 [Streptomyces hirsutus]